MNELILIDLISQLKQQVAALKSEIAALLAEKTDLTDHIIPALRADYMKKLGDLEYRIRYQQMLVAELKYRISILQAAINRAETVTSETVDAKVKQEYQEYQEKVNREYERAEEERKAQEEAERKRAANEAQYRTRGNAGTQSDSKELDPNPDGSRQQSNGSQDNSGKTHKNPDIPDDYDTMTVKQKLKVLYRAIVKKLHPDINPDITPHEKELWMKAQTAYKEGDLETLESIFDEINEVAVDDIPDTEEGREQLEALIEKLTLRRSEIIREIEELKSQFPYTMKDFLAYEAAVAAKQQEYQAVIAQYESLIKELNERIQDLTQQMQSKRTTQP